MNSRKYVMTPNNLSSNQNCRFVVQFFFLILKWYVNRPLFNSNVERVCSLFCVAPQITRRWEKKQQINTEMNCFTFKLWLTLSHTSSWNYITQMCARSLFLPPSLLLSAVCVVCRIALSLLYCKYYASYLPRRCCECFRFVCTTEQPHVWSM